ncbi:MULTISPECIES: hypothetical protein [Hydrotalea]|uniref:hypothetical protein n=1 Tax=Hydrotalea TaxID=1004300 RepID=UPI0015CEF9F7|nr:MULTISPECIES: hypothetical protein [Hydrotalea]
MKHTCIFCYQQADIAAQNQRMVKKVTGYWYSCHHSMAGNLTNIKINNSIQNAT